MKKNESARPLPGMPVGFAHRGARSERRENTLDAFARGLELGATGLETDAWLTADGEVVLDHDGVVGPPWRRTAISVLRRADMPQHIPTLGELYDCCGDGFELSIDVKDPYAFGPLVEVARSRGAAERLWLCYHDWRPMAAWRRAAPDVHLVESTNVAWMREGLAAHASTVASAGIDGLNLHRSQWDLATVREVRAVGLVAFAWDAQDGPEIDRLLACGVDGLYSDHPGLLMERIAAMGA